MRGSEKATRALKISGAPFPNARKVTPWGEHVKGTQSRGPRLARPVLGHEPPPPSLPDSPPTALPHSGVQTPGQKDTATLWDSLSTVEMADKLGQKLWRESKQGVPSRPSST